MATDRGVDEAGLVIVLIVDELNISDLYTSLLFYGCLDLLAKLDRVLVIGQAGKHKRVSDRDLLATDKVPAVLKSARLGVCHRGHVRRGWRRGLHHRRSGRCRRRL